MLSKRVHLTSSGSQAAQHPWRGSPFSGDGRPHWDGLGCRRRWWLAAWRLQGVGRARRVAHGYGRWCALRRAACVTGSASRCLDLLCVCSLELAHGLNARAGVRGSRYWNRELMAGVVGIYVVFDVFTRGGLIAVHRTVRAGVIRRKAPRILPEQPPTPPCRSLPKSASATISLKKTERSQRRDVELAAR
jgi:hypothetical protein